MYGCHKCDMRFITTLETMKSVCNAIKLIYKKHNLIIQICAVTCNMNTKSIVLTQPYVKVSILTHPFDFLAQRCSQGIAHSRVA